MSIVQYNGNRLIPAPLMNITKDFVKTGDGEIIGSTFSVSLNGTIVAFKGSPTSSGSWHTGTGYPSDEVVSSNLRLEAIQRKQEAIRNLFKDEGKLLVIQAIDGTLPVSGIPRQIRIDFPQGQWYDRSEYSITMEFDWIGRSQEDSFSYYLNDAGESWNVETNEGEPEGLSESRTYRLSHSVNATGKRRYNNGILIREPWQEARSWVHTKLGFDSTIALSSGVNNLPSYYGGYNHVRNEVVDKKGGSYSVSETWVLTSGTALEDFTVSTNESIDNVDTTVTIAGNIVGLEIRNSGLLTTAKYTNANTKFTAVSGLALTRAQTYSGTTLNIKPSAFTVGKNPVAGTINYSFTYDTRPSNLIANAKSEVISVNDNVDGGASFAEIFVLGKTYGPVLQALSTRPSFKRTLNIELIVDRPVVSGAVSSIYNAFYNNPRVNTATSGDIENVIYAINPSNYGISQCYSDPPQENWDFLKGRYSYNRTWTYVPSG